MKRIKSRVGDIVVMERQYPIPSIDIYKGNDLIFSTNRVDTLHNLTKAITGFFKKLNKNKQPNK